MEVYRIDNLIKSYGGKIVIDALSLTIDQGSFTTIYGKSGCGKTTLLNILGLLDTYNEGTILYNDKKYPKPFSNKARSLLRNDISYLYQEFALIENKSVYYNLEMVLPKMSKSQKVNRINDVLAQVDLPKEILYQKIATCSGGEQQRIAVARILLKQSKVVLCDEPTGSLDKENALNIMKLLQQLNTTGITIIVVTHDETFIEYSTQVIKL